MHITSKICYSRRQGSFSEVINIWQFGKKNVPYLQKQRKARFANFSLPLKKKGERSRNLPSALSPHGLAIKYRTACFYYFGRFSFPDSYNSICSGNASCRLQYSSVENVLILNCSRSRVVAEHPNPRKLSRVIGPAFIWPSIKLPGGLLPAVGQLPASAYRCRCELLFTKSINTLAL